MNDLLQNQTASPLTFRMVQSGDHRSALTGAIPTVTLSKNGGAFVAAVGSVSEIGNGCYAVAGNATDSSTLGPLLLHATAAGGDPADEKYQVNAIATVRATDTSGNPLATAAEVLQVVRSTAPAIDTLLQLISVTATSTTATLADGNYANNLVLVGNEMVFYDVAQGQTPTTRWINSVTSDGGNTVLNFDALPFDPSGDAGLISLRVTTTRLPTDNSGGGLSGPSSINVQWVDESNNPVPLVNFTVQGVGSGTAGSDGATHFGIPDGGYTVTSQVTNGVFFADTALAASGHTELVIHGTGISLDVPDNPADVTAFIVLLDPAAPVVGASISYRMVTAPAGDALGYDFSIKTSPVSDDTGMIQFPVAKGSEYQFWWKSGKKQNAVIPSAGGNFPIPALWTATN